MRIKFLNSKGFAPLVLLIAVAVVLVVGGSGVYVHHHNHKAKASTKTSTQTNKSGTSSGKTAVTTPDPYAGWKTYKSSKEGLSFKYPSTWTVPAAACDDQSCQFLTPQTSSSPYVFEIGFDWDAPVPPTAIQGGETIKTLTPIQVPNTKTPLSLVGFSENQLSTDNIFGLTLTDQSYSVGQTVGKIPNVQSQTQSGITYALAAVMKTPSQQDNEGYTLAQYQTQPDYNNVVKMFQSLSY